MPGELDESLKKCGKKWKRRPKLCQSLGCYFEKIWCCLL